MRLHFAQILQGDTLDPMSVLLARTLQEEILKWCPTASVATVAWASMSKANAITHACRFVAASPQSFLFARRVDATPIDWCPEAERRLLLGLASDTHEAVAAMDKSLPSPTRFVGALCRLRFVQRRECSSTAEKLQDLWVRVKSDKYEWVHVPSMRRVLEGAAWSKCTVFSSIPGTQFIVGIRGKHVLLGTLESPHLQVESTVRQANVLESEVIPSGSIIVSISQRNEDTGGACQSETMAFRISEENTLEPVQLNKHEAADAQKNAEERERSKHFDFSTVTCPLGAIIHSPWHADIVLQEDIVWRDENHGTVVGLIGHPHDMWLVHASGIVLHVMNGTVETRSDVGTPCFAAISLLRPHV